MWDKQNEEDDEAEKEAAEIAKRIALCEAKVPRHGPITTAVHTSEVRPIVQVTVVQDHHCNQQLIGQQ